MGSRSESEDGAMEAGKGAGEKAERGTLRGSRRSSEGWRRTLLSSVFPEAQHHQIAYEAGGAFVLVNIIHLVVDADEWSPWSVWAISYSYD